LTGYLDSHNAQLLPQFASVASPAVTTALISAKRRRRSNGIEKNEAMTILPFLFSFPFHNSFSIIQLEAPYSG